MSSHQQNVVLKIAPYFARAGVLFFVSKDSYNKSYNNTNENLFRC